MKGIKYGKTLTVKKSIHNKYKNKLLKFTKSLYKNIMSEIVKAYKTNDNNYIQSVLAELNIRYENIAENVGNKITTDFVASTKDDFLKTYSMGWSYEYEDRLQAEIINNVALIKNLPQKAIFEVSQEVFNSVANDENNQSLVDRLKTRYGIDIRRAETIARDQTAKLFNVMDEITQTSNGIEFYEWSTVEDERVSTGKGGHKQLNHKIYKWNETIEDRKPIIDSYGNTGKPGQRVNCRCIGLPVFVEKGYTMIWDNSQKTYKPIKKVA